MKRWQTGALSALALVAGLTAQQASAQDIVQGLTLRGIRADAQVGIDKFYSEGVNDRHIAWGGAVGFDTFVGDNFVLGLEGTFLNSRAENISRDGPGRAERKSFEEWGGAIRAGIMFTPSTLIYGKAGIVVNEQRKFFDADTIGRRPAGFGDYYNNYETRGWVVGGGVEQLLSDSIYVKAEGRYANYRTNSSRLTGLIGIGVLLFRPAEPVFIAPPPPPPPPELAPATQTCPDGSVILATDICPQPVFVPPPPPEPIPERG